MKGELTAKVRVVRCPKCRELLPELPDLDVYKCGGCGTILQAKRSKHDSVAPVAVAAKSDGSGIVLKVDEFGNKTRLEMSSSECVSREDSGGDQKRSEELNGENVGCVPEVNEEQYTGNKKNLSNSITEDNRFLCEAFSSEVSHSDTEDSRAVVPLHVLNSPLATGSDSSWCSLSVGEEEGSPSTQAEDEGTYVVVGKSQLDQNGTNSTPERSTEENLVTMARNCSHNSASGHMGDDIKSSIPSSPDKRLQYAHARSELNVKGSKSTSRSFSVEKPVTMKGNNSPFSARKPVRTTSSSYGLSSSAQLHQDHQSSYARSMDEKGTRDPVKKNDDNCRDVFRSSVTRSFHAYDGSISSCDGIEDQFFNQNLNSLESSGRVSVYEERPNRRSSLVSNISRESLKNQLSKREFSSELSCKKHCTMREMKQDQNELLEGMNKIHDSRVKNWMGRDRRECHSRTSHFPRERRSEFQSRSLSDQFYNDFPYNSSSFDSPDMYENPNHERMKFLKMVDELQDQLRRTSYYDGKFDRRVATHDLSSEIHTSVHNNLEAYERARLHDYHNRRYPGRCRHGSNWQQTHKYSRIPFSAEASTSKQPHDHPCIHCHTQDFRYSEELHPPFHCRKSGFCTSHLDYNGCTCQSSCPSTPIRYVDSEFQRQVHNDHRRRSLEVNFLREKQQRHFRPIAGGAPFITCQNCHKLLQLPEEFLVFKRRCHLIKCGSCSKVLKFSLLDKSHLVSYAPDGIEPPPSMVDIFETVAPMDNPMPLIDADFSASADHVSYYGYNGLSLCKSNSCKDPAVLSTVHFHQNVHNGNRSCDSNEKGRDDGGLRQPLDKTKAPADTDESARPSSSMIRPELPSSDKEEQPSPVSSPLHRLMGYSSPSHIIRGTLAMIQGTSSFNSIEA